MFYFQRMGFATTSWVVGETRTIMIRTRVSTNTKNNARARVRSTSAYIAARNRLDRWSWCGYYMYMIHVNGYSLTAFSRTKRLSFFLFLKKKNHHQQINREEICFFLCGAQWGRTAKNRDVSTGPLTLLFTRLLTPLTHSLPSSRERVIRCPKTTWFCPTVR